MTKWPFNNSLLKHLLSEKKNNSKGFIIYILKPAR